MNTLGVRPRRVCPRDVGGSECASRLADVAVSIGERTALLNFEGSLLNEGGV